MLTRDITYKNYRKRDDIHGTVLYPAVMVAPVQKDILNDVLNKDVRTSVFDPFHGSGTALYEATEISNNVDLYGCDINPLANLITKVKLQGITDSIEKDIEKIVDCLGSDISFEIHSFPNILKWFRQDFIMDLSKIRTAITKIEDKSNRLFFWSMFIDIVRKYSNTRTSTYKLHTKKEIDIAKQDNSIISDYISSIRSNYQRYQKNYSSFTLIKGDVLTYLKDCPENHFNICITSPPYGDNATTVPYGQFSILPLFWIDIKDLELEGWEFENLSIIDSKSLGGPFQTFQGEDKDFELLSKYIKKISISKQKKVLRFFAGYFEFLEQICRVTNSYIIMTLGNRTVDGVKINLTELTIQYLGSRGFSKKEVVKREIINKRIPKRVSNVRNRPVSSMNEEYVIVMEKK